VESNEWALITFTILIQASVGAFVFLTWFRQSADEKLAGNYRKAVLVLLPLVLVAMLASLAHLGKPAYAVRALLHLQTSWLSREIFFTGGFLVLLAATVLTEKSPAIRKVCEWLAVLAGLCALFSMSTMYHMTMKPAWQGFNTYIVFFAGAALLGAGLCAGLLALFGGHEQVNRNLYSLTWVAGAALVVELIALPFYMAALQNAGPAGQATLSLLSGTLGSTLIVRWALTLVGAVPLMVASRRVLQGKNTSALVYSALLFLLAGEVVGRYLFYATGIRIMIG